MKTNYTYTFNKEPRKHSFSLVKKTLLSTLCTIFVYAASADIISHNPNYIHINMNQLQQNQHVYDHLDLASIRDSILLGNNKYLIDFSEIKSATELEHAKQQFYKLSVISFNEDRIVISRYGNGLLYTPVDGSDHNSLQNALNCSTKIDYSKSQQQDSDDSTSNNHPMIGAAICVTDTETMRDKCQFPTTFGFTGHAADKYANFCNNPEMHLIYSVKFFRSMGSTGHNTKLAYVSIHRDATGNGIKLNDNFRFLTAQETGIVAGDPRIFKTYSYSAIAQKYRFTVTADHDTATLLTGHPNNQSREYRYTYQHSTTIGITPKATLAKTPSFGVDAVFSHAYTQWLSFDTADYSITRSGDAHSATFEFERDTFKTASSLMDSGGANCTTILDACTSTLFNGGLTSVLTDVGLFRVKPIGYANFKPNFLTAFMPKNNADTSTFNVFTHVQIRPIYYDSIGQLLAFHYRGNEQKHHWKTASKKVSYKVHWDHPIFLGGWPIALALKDYNGCIGTNKQFDVINKLCDYKDVQQSFLYDRQLNYRSATDITMCLDAANLNKLSKCNYSPSQRWRWRGEYLYNNVNNRVLIYNKKDGLLSLASSVNTIPDGYSANVGTEFNDILKQ